MKIQSQLPAETTKIGKVPPKHKLLTRGNNEDSNASTVERVSLSREIPTWEYNIMQAWVWATEKVSPSHEQLTQDRIQKRKRSSTRSRKKHEPHKILRFRKSERHVHWTIAIPFMVCFASALILVFFYNPNPLRPYRDVFSWIHRISGISLIVMPLLAMFKSRHDYKIYFYNIRQAWVWTFEDIKWLALKGVAAINKKIKLPDQGKFNAAEKINFMMLMSTYPLYIVTGLVIWLTDGALLSWLVHFGMALFATPLLLGHLYMATIHPDTRTGLSGMTSGFVDRHWAEHHYPLWYREQFENDGRYAGIDPHITPLSDESTESHARREKPDDLDFIKSG
jgi:formate dehydrogenase subunit gamma